MIYLKELNTNRIVEFQSEASIGAGFANWTRLNQEESLAYELEEAKASKLNQIKSQASRRITALYPDWKQQNLNAAITRIQNKEVLALKAGGSNYTPTDEEMTELKEANNCEIFIKAIRAKSNKLEASLESKTLDQLKAFDPSGNLNWQ